MEQIVKIFVHQSYFIENDLAVDYNVQQGARVNVSAKDWIALIPKGWSGVDEQVAFKTVDVDSGVENEAIKSVVIERKYFEKVVGCGKQYQLMYVSQYLEILGRSEYFMFVHRSDECDCDYSRSARTEIGENVKRNRLPSTVAFGRKPPRRRSPTPREFYKNRLRSHDDPADSGVTSTIPVNQRSRCGKCDAPNNYPALESAYLARIQDLSVRRRVMDECLSKIEQDLARTLDDIDEKFRLTGAISRQKDDVQKFIDGVVDGILADGKTTFRVDDREFSVVREFPGENLQTSSSSSDESPPFNKWPSLSSEAHMKAIIVDQERTIQHLVDKIKDSFDFFSRENAPSEEEPVMNNNVGYMDSSGTTYYSPRPPAFIANALNDTSLYYSPDCKEKDNPIQRAATNENAVSHWINDIGSVYKRSAGDTLEPKKTTEFFREIKENTLAFQEWKKNRKDYKPFDVSHINGFRADETVNGSDFNDPNEKKFEKTD